MTVIALDAVSPTELTAATWILYVYSGIRLRKQSPNWLLHFFPRYRGFLRLGSRYTLRRKNPHSWNYPSNRPPERHGLEFPTAGDRLI